MVLAVDGDLYIVADSSGPFAAGRHRTGIGIGQRDLLVGCVLNRLLHYLQGLHLPAQAGNLLLELPCGLLRLLVCLVAMASFSTSASRLSRCLHTPNTGARNAIARGEELFNYT